MNRSEFIDFLSEKGECSRFDEHQIDGIEQFCFALYENTELDKTAECIAELERELRDIKKPQFWLDNGNDFCGGYFHCNHCSFSTNQYTDKDEHKISCQERENYLKGGVK